MVKVIRSGLDRLASAAIAVESMPPDRKDPTVTSARMCLATESSSTSAIRSYRALRPASEDSVTGANVGRKYRVVDSSLPGVALNDVPAGIRRIRRSMVAGSGTYWSTR